MNMLIRKYFSLIPSLLILKIIVEFVGNLAML